MKEKIFSENTSKIIIKVMLIIVLLSILCLFVSDVREIEPPAQIERFYE